MTTASASPSASPPASASAPATPEDAKAALALVDEGRVIQTERGEGGALDAVAKYQAALAKDPRCAAAFWELGWSYQLLSRWDDAVAAWQSLEALDPHYPELEKSMPVLVMRRDQAAELAALPDAAKLPEPEIVPRRGPTLAITAVGDVQMGRGWPNERATLPPNDAQSFFDGVASILRDGDLTFGNLETALADTGDSGKCGKRSTHCFAFRVPTSFAKTLNDAGFDFMSIANNHAGDFGLEGRASTKKALDALGIHHSGPIGDLAFFETNGLKIGFVAFTTGGGMYAVQDLATARKVIADIDQKADIVIVSFHAGAEGTSAAHVPKTTETFLGENRGDVMAFAHTVVDAGADLVLGHGPHLWRGAEVYKGRFIAYSMGNFCTWDTFNVSGPLGISGVLKVKLAANGVALEAELVPTVLPKPGMAVPDPKRQVIDIVRSLSRADFGEPLFDPNGKWKLQQPVATHQPSSPDSAATRLR